MSNFPDPITFSQHNTHIYLSKMSISNDQIPLVLKKIKGVYLYDIDGFKYTDFNLQNGEISFSYTPRVLTKIYKNALSSGIGHACCYNKFLLKAYRYWEELTQNGVSFFSDPIYAVLSFLNDIKNTNKISIACSSDYIYRMLEPLREFIDVTYCYENTYSDLLIYEPIFEDGSLFDADRFYAHKKLVVYNRFFFRQQLNFNCKHPILLSYFFAGKPLTVLIGNQNNCVDKNRLSIYETILFMEGAKYLKKQMKRKNLKVCHHFLNSFNGFAIAKKPLDFNFFCKRGIIANDLILFFSPYHTEHDLRRLYKALDEYVIHISNDNLDQK
ncbi:hypothetical protein SAMN02745150_00493 [Brevinema andersonii]|uniref:DegT/DnrJ/EryC1/StrS aminotransferase family protein n=1 Tax=Brevinema andersonii TaxID=34097 RepID=A0A1I1DLW0_BREAD|nr:hypothetical protein [Brevinema andersonii]SFB73710.1 hypothetical protein SAMN02745150_00493 [Brevinema andersonii]